MRGRLILILIILCGFKNLQAQSIQLKLDSIKSQSFPTLSFNSVKFLDADRDGDQDLIIMGQSSMMKGQTSLFLNDGKGNFTKDSRNEFKEMSTGSIAEIDINGDEFEDILLVGKYVNFSSGGASAFVYINDGSGKFSELESSPFEGAILGSTEIADIDGDKDIDVFICGQSKEGLIKSTLYRNDGNGTFEAIDNGIAAVYYSSASFGDVDNDGDSDLFIFGQLETQRDYVSELYINNGKGKFSKTENTFVKLMGGDSEFTDVDMDGDMDLLVVGSMPQNLQNANSNVTKLYINDGKGNFTESKNNLFEGLFAGEIIIADLDNDLDPDFFLSGLNNYNQPFAKIYKNEKGQFTELNVSGLTGLIENSSDFADIDQDGDVDIFITGETRTFSNTFKSWFYINELNKK